MRIFINIIFVILLNVSLIIAQGKSENSEPTEPNITFDWKWGVAQLIPSPEWISNGNSSKFGMRWQITPLLFSYSINKKLSPWRFFITDPLARQSGSVELFFTPEYLNIEKEFKTKWLFREGVRIYIPLWQKGEYASLSFATSYFNFNGNTGIAYESGVYLFAGILGFQVTYSPKFENHEWIYTIRLRYF